MNWIRIAVDIMDDPSVHALASALGVNEVTTTGHLVGLLVKLPTHAKSGDLSAITDPTLEAWARWRGKRGKFAAAFRAHLCDTQGVVRAWEKHNGAALREADRTRERAKEWRDKKAADAVANGERTGYKNRTYSVDETRRDVDETRRNSSTQRVRSGGDDGSSSRATSSGDDGARSPVAIGLVFDGIAPCVAPVGHDALRELLTSVQQPVTWAGIIRGCASGQSMPEGRPASAERIAAAVQDFVAGGHHLDRRGLTKLFRGYVSSAKASSAQTRQWLNVDEDKADELRTIREQNERRRKRNEAQKTIPTWAAEIDAKFPDGRTWPAGAVA